MPKQLSLSDLSAANFEPLEGQGFLVAHPGHQETLILEQVTHETYEQAGAHKAFSLFLRGESSSVMLNQGIHMLQHTELGSLEIFMVPIGRYPDGSHRYQIVFN